MMVHSFYWHMIFININANTEDNSRLDADVHTFVGTAVKTDRFTLIGL